MTERGLGESPGDVILAALDALYSWHAPRPGLTIFGSHFGRLLLTRERLLFLSSGTNGIPRALGANLLGGLPMQLIVGQTPTAALDLSALTNAGSFDLLLPRITHSAVKRRFDWSSYLVVGIHTAAGPPRLVSFMTRSGLFDRASLVAFRDALENARRRVPHTPSGE